MPNSIVYNVSQPSAWYEDAMRQAAQAAASLFGPPQQPPPLVLPERIPMDVRQWFHKNPQFLARQPAAPATPEPPAAPKYAKHLVDPFGLIDTPEDPKQPNEELLKSFTLRQEGVAQPYYTKADANFGTAANPFTATGLVQRYMSPYTGGLLKELGDQATRNWTQQIAPQIRGQFIRRGAYGGLRHHGAEHHVAGKLAEAFERQKQEVLHRAYGQAAQIYDHDRQAMHRAGESQAQLGRMAQASNLADISAAQDAANLRQQYAMKAHNIKRFEWEEEHLQPEKKLFKLASVLHGTPNMGGTSSEVRYEPQPQQMNAAGNVGSLAGQMFGASMLGRKKGGLINFSSFKPPRLQKKVGLNILGKAAARSKQSSFAMPGKSFKKFQSLPKLAHLSSVRKKT